MKEVSVSLLNPFAPRSHFQSLPFTRTTLIHSNQSSSSSSSISFGLKTPFLPTISRCFNLLRHHSNPNFKFTRRVISSNMELGLDGFSDSNIDSELPVDLSYTSTLPPALTLQHGLIKIKEAIEKLKSNPPRSTSGLLRFQVAVPPDTKASSWLGSESQSSEVFPQFYLSKMDSDNKTLDPCLVNGALGIWGIGAAVYFSCSSSCDSRKWNLIKRYLSVDSPLVTAYGFVGIDFDTEASSVRHDIGSFFLFIPQIELHEYGSASLLAATLAWNDASFCNFSTAVRSTELSLHQAVNHFSSKEIYQNKCINSTLKQLDRVDVEMVYINEHSQFGKGASTNHGRSSEFFSVLFQALTNRCFDQQDVGSSW